MSPTKGYKKKPTNVEASQFFVEPCSPNKLHSSQGLSPRASPTSIPISSIGSGKNQKTHKSQRKIRHSVQIGTGRVFKELRTSIPLSFLTGEAVKKRPVKRNNTQVGSALRVTRLETSSTRPRVKTKKVKRGYWNL